jgi:hypothetical protein
MSLIHHNATTRESGDRPRDTLASYFARYRFALYLLSGVGIAAGITLSWNSLAVAKLLPILVFLPCIAMMLMMFMGMKHGTKTPTESAAEPIKKPLVPQQ